MNQRIYKMILTSLFTAAVIVATILIQIPMPMQGYVNLGDGIILLSAWLLGPAAGFFAGGAGSMLADLFTGYSYYAPGSFLIKGGMGLVAALLFSFLHKGTVQKPDSGSIRRKKKKTEHKAPLFSLLLSAIAAEAVMVLGYFSYACLLLGNGLAAKTGIPGNLVQAFIGIVSAILLYPLLKRAKISQK